MNLKKVEGYVLKTQADCYRALLEGYYLKNIDSNEAIHLNNNGTLVNDKGEWVWCIFKNPNNFTVFAKENWHDNIPENGVLCWVSDNEENINSDKFPKNIDIIYRMYKRRELPNVFGGKNASWLYAKPVNPELIKNLILQGE